MFLLVSKNISVRKLMENLIFEPYLFKNQSAEIVAFQR